MKDTITVMQSQYYKETEMNFPFYTKRADGTGEGYTKYIPTQSLEICFWHGPDEKIDSVDITFDHIGNRCILDDNEVFITKEEFDDAYRRALDVTDKIVNAYSE